MVYYQLYNELPDKDFINQVCELYGIQDFDTNYIFSLRDLEKLETVKKLTELGNEFKKYYLNCKYKKYVEDLNEKKSITLLRQLLKLIQYKVISREKYSDGRKYLIYHIKNMNINPDDYDLTIDFT